MFCLHVCLCEAVVVLELELQTGVSCHVGAGNRTLILWENSQRSFLLSHFCSPQTELSTRMTHFQVVNGSLLGRPVCKLSLYVQLLMGYQLRGEGSPGFGGVILMSHHLPL